MNKENISKITLEEEVKKKKEQIKEQMEQNLIETKTFTPVTKERFESWFKAFYAKHHKVDKVKLEQETRQSGREYFMNLKNQKTEGDDETGLKAEDTEGESTGNAVFYDAGAFEENIDDIDFDQVDLEDDS